MKILVISNNYPNSKVYLSGVFVHEQVKCMNTNGHELVVIAAVPYVPYPFVFFSKKWQEIKKIPFVEELDGIRIFHPRFIALPKGYFKNYWGYSYFLLNWFFLKDFFRKHNFDLIHIHGSAPEDNFGYLLAIMYKLPYILTVHGDSVYSLVKKPKRFKNSKRAIIKANAVISVSSRVLERVVNFTGRKKNNFIIYNGFIPPNYIRNDKLNSEINILFVGNLIYRKGCQYLIEAFNILCQEFNCIKLIIVGSGELRSELVKQASNLSCHKNIEFAGQLNHSSVLEYMQDCDIFVLPSWDEAFGVVYLEAMAFCKPVIGTKGEGISDLISDGFNGFLVKPKNVDDIVLKLKLLINDVNLRKKIGKEGYNSIKKYTWEYNAKGTIDVYKKVLYEK